MNWTDGPATWKQLKYLSSHGYKPERVLTKSEAADLIRKFGGNPDALLVSAEKPAPDPSEQQTAHHLRIVVEEAKHALTKQGFFKNEKLQQDFAAAVAKRLEFWLDTCRDVRKTFVVGKQALDLFQKHGCRFVAPAPKQVQYILDALDSAMPAWEKEHPELFYQTMQLNFPELVRAR